MSIEFQHNYLEMIMLTFIFETECRESTLISCLPTTDAI